MSRNQNWALVSILMIQIALAYGHVIPIPNPRSRTFTSHMTDNGRQALAESLYYLCTLKPSSQWIQLFQSDVLEKALIRDDTEIERALKSVLIENIMRNALSQCQTDEIGRGGLTEQPSKTVREAESNYVENILSNVFRGNIVELLQSYSGRSAERMSSVVSDIFRSLLNNVNSMRSQVVPGGNGRSGINNAPSSTPKPRKRRPVLVIGK